jgi:hypothetical protein
MYEFTVKEAILLFNENNKDKITEVYKNNDHLEINYKKGNYALYPYNDYMHVYDYNTKKFIEFPSILNFLEYLAQF